jgi:hypothetical protein
MKNICLVVISTVVFFGCIPPASSFYIKNGSNEPIEVHCLIREDFTRGGQESNISVLLQPNKKVQLDILSSRFFSQTDSFDYETKKLNMDIFMSVFNNFLIDLLDSEITLTADDMKIDFIKFSCIIEPRFTLIIPAPEKRTGY